MDFKDTLMQSLNSAKGLSDNRSRIRTTLEKFSADIFEATQSKVKITYRPTFGSDIELGSILSDVVSLDSGAGDKSSVIYIYANGTTDAKGTALAKFTWPAVNGFPCHLEFDGLRYISQDIDELELALKEMLASPFTSQKIYNFYITG